MRQNAQYGRSRTQYPCGLPAGMAGNPHGICALAIRDGEINEAASVWLVDVCCW
ncbi:hypothetical protein [Undibacterium sp. Ren11W]|uniref:hypothetical protein n=1 Tax=Undibacterium sp. Ren11W TaxID=3413045 RepID=UPI003BF2E0DB